MKKLLLLLFSILFSFNSYGEELKSLFGITLYDNAEKHVSSNFIDSNKFDHDESSDNYYYLIITDNIKTKSPYASRYLVIVDNYNIVHQIYGDADYINLDICQAVRKDLLSQIEEKYQIKFKYGEKSFPEFKRYTNYHYTSSGNYFTIQCKETYSDSPIKLQVIFRNAVMSKAINEFYETGI